MNAGMIELSQTARKMRQTMSEPKFFAAAWQRSAMPQTRMFRLSKCRMRGREVRARERGPPHPFRYWEPLQGQVLRVARDEVEHIEHRAEEVELVLVEVCVLAVFLWSVRVCRDRSYLEGTRTVVPESRIGRERSCRRIAVCGSHGHFKRLDSTAIENTDRNMTEKNDK